jgi:dipeptide/tripeptide permease
MTSEDSRGSAYGLMGAVNGMGDLTASALVGTVWTLVSPEAAFGGAAVLMLLGTIVVAADRPLHVTLT